VNRRIWMLMLGAAATWGASYMFIKIALEDLSEGALVWVRVALGALVLLPLAARAGALAPLRGRMGWLAGITLLQVVGPFLLIATGQNHVPSAMAGILVSSAPLFTALLAARFDTSERLRGWGGAGVLIGMAGVVVLFGLDLSATREALVGGVLILLAALGYAISALLVKARLGGVPAVGIVAGEMAIAAVVTLPLFVVGAPSALPGADTVLAMVALGAGGTGLAFLWYYTLLAELGPGRATLIAYLAPGFAVLYGALLLAEPITGATVAGLALILLGSWLGTSGRLPFTRRSGPSRSTAPAPARAR
jgi:drug/metabolite transporter (DMT)-like permease